MAGELPATARPYLGRAARRNKTGRTMSTAGRRRAHGEPRSCYCSWRSRRAHLPRPHVADTAASPESEVPALVRAVVTRDSRRMRGRGRSCRPGIRRCSRSSSRASKRGPSAGREEAPGSPGRRRSCRGQERSGGDRICRHLSSMGRALGTDDMDAVLMLGALAWMGALLAGVAVIGDGPMGPVLTLGGIAAFIVMAICVTIVPRRLRWRGDIRPRSTGRPAEPGSRLKPAQIAAEERWGVTQQITDKGWVREVGRLSWRQATVFLVGDKTGLVVDPWFLSRQAYVFDSICRVSPGPTPATLNPGFNFRRKNGVLRISQGTQVIDLAVPKKIRARCRPHRGVGAARQGGRHCRHRLRGTPRPDRAG